MTTMTTMTILETGDLTGQILSDADVERARAALAQMRDEGVLGSVHVGHGRARVRLITGDLATPTPPRSSRRGQKEAWVGWPAPTAGQKKERGS